MNIFKEKYRSYIDAGYSVIPDKFMMKTPAIKNWSSYCYEKPTEEELSSWSETFMKSNIAICLGTASGVVALDIDEVRPEILDVIMPMLPKSPVTKKGAKGETRFFKYTGVEHTQALQFGGEMVIELLSNNKKTTIPPSVHPSGESYSWGENGLLDVDVNDLPMLPPALFVSVEQKLLLKFPDMEKVGSTGKLHSGRNDALVSLCAKLIQEQRPMEEALSELIKQDQELHEPPLFSDANEYFHTEPRTNALNLYSNVLESINRKRYRDSKEYEIPIANVVSAEDYAKAVEERGKKSISRGELERQNQGLSHAPAVKKKCPCCGKWKRC
jgi:hypothetical protein